MTILANSFQGQIQICQSLVSNFTLKLPNQRDLVIKIIVAMSPKILSPISTKKINLLAFSYFWFLFSKNIWAKAKQSRNNNFTEN